MQHEPIHAYAARHGFSVPDILKHAGVEHAKELTAIHLREYEVHKGLGSEDELGHPLTLDEHEKAVQEELEGLTGAPEQQ